MAENKMEQVAAIFGKKLGERFNINHGREWYRFTEYGVEHWDKGFKCWFDSPASELQKLITGKEKITDD